MTGTLSPDATGLYRYAGQYLGHDYFDLVGGGYSIWSNVPGTTWYISVAPGNVEGGEWHKAWPGIVGEFTPTAPYTGTATAAQVD